MLRGRIVQGPLVAAGETTGRTIPPMLPANCRWSDTPDASFLYRNYACIAVVRPGRVEISRGRKKAPLPPLVGVCGSIAHGKRQVEAWLAASRKR